MKTTSGQDALTTRPATDLNAERVWREAGYIFGVLGPHEIDGWAFMTDRVGFLAIRGANADPPMSEQHAEAARKLLSLSADRSVSLADLREFVDERCKAQDDSKCVECLIFGRSVDARFVKKWLACLPEINECRTAGVIAEVKQKQHTGESLLFEGDGWKLLIAGLVGKLKYPPTYDQKVAAHA